VLKKLCQEQFKLTRALEEENRRKQGENVCEFIVEAGEEKVPFFDGMKVDYKPDKLCDGTDNVDTFFPAWVVSKNVVESGGVKKCAFDIGYACDLDVNAKTFR